MCCVRAGSMRCAAFEQGACDKLDKTPDSVDAFVDHLSFLGGIAARMPAIAADYAVVIKLYAIAKEFELPMDPEHYALFQTLSPAFQHLKVSFELKLRSR